MKKVLCGLVAILALGTLNVRAQNAAAAPAGDSQQGASFIPSIGTRVTHYWLTDHSRNDNNTYLGSIDQFDARQINFPTKLYADWRLCRYANCELTWDQIKAAAQSEHGAGDSDGTVIMQGPILTLDARYPNSTRLTPHAGVGVALWNGHFDHAPWHEYGFSSETDWEAAGEPGDSPNGKYRHIYVDNALGFVATIGADYAICRNWSVDIYGRYIDINPDYDYRVNVGGSTALERKGSFPMSNFAAGLGVKYSF